MIRSLNNLLNLKNIIGREPRKQQRPLFCIPNKIPEFSKQMIDQSSQIANNSLSDSSNSHTKSVTKNPSIISKKCSKNNPSSNLQSKNSSIESGSLSSDKKQTCINKICPKSKNSQGKIQAKLTAFDPNELCDNCTIQYQKQAYCMYCKQIYFDSSDDGKQWILCDQCGKWVHSQCANYDSSFDSNFKCIKCKKLEPSENLTPLLKKQSTKPNPKQPIDRRKQLAECSLNSYGFYWQLGPKQLAQDLDKIREYLN